MERTIRKAVPGDEGKILKFIRELAEYEHLENEVVATEEILAHWLFEKEKAQTVFVLEDGVEVGFALYFYNFSTFLGRAGIYLEDLYVVPSARGRGHGKALLNYLAKKTVEEGCGRLEWSCLDWNAPSLAFYRSVGAVPMDEWTVQRLSGETLEKFANEP